MAGILLYNLTSEQISLLTKFATDNRMFVMVPTAYAPLDYILPENDNYHLVAQMLIDKAQQTPRVFDQHLASIIDLRAVLEEPGDYKNLDIDTAKFLVSEANKARIPAEGPAISEEVFNAFLAETGYGQ